MAIALLGNAEAGTVGHCLLIDTAAPERLIRLLTRLVYAAADAGKRVDHLLNANGEAGFGAASDPDAAAEYADLLEAHAADAWGGAAPLEDWRDEGAPPEWWLAEQTDRYRDLARFLRQSGGVAGGVHTPRAAACRCRAGSAAPSNSAALARRAAPLYRRFESRSPVLLQPRSRTRSTVKRRLRSAGSYQPDLQIGAAAGR